MAQTREGAIIIAARRAGVTLEFYLAQVASGLKWCWHCRMWKPIDKFGSDRSRSDGRDPKCRDCRRPPKQLALIVETQAEYERRHYASDADFRFRRRQRVYARRRNINPMPIEGRDALLEAFAGLCAYCSNDAETWDHIVPVSKGGRTEPGNMLPACASCNSRKKDRDVYDFIDAAGIVVSSELEGYLSLALEWGQLTI